MKRNPAEEDHNRTAAPIEPVFDDADDVRRSGSNEDIRRLRALTVLELLTASPQPLTLAQLATQMSVPKSTLMRLLRSMESQGYVLHMPAERGFVAGTGAISLALRTLRGSNVRRACRAVLRGLVRRLGETCNLTVPDAGRVLYVERVDTSEPLRMHLQPGTWVPMHCTASGKLFLSAMPLLERQRLLDHLVLNRSSPRTLVERPALEAELDRLAKKGFGIDNEEFVRGMIAIAVPVRDASGQLVAGIACHAPTARLTLDELMAHVPHLRAAAERMAQVLVPDASVG
jgi:DNA-binding IclR family transcriptional regulator